jgi:hypothetical protein
MPAGFAFGSLDTGTPKFTFSTNLITASQPVAAPSFSSSPAGGVGGGLAGPEGTVPSTIGGITIPQSGYDGCYFDSTAHGWKCSFNNGAFANFPAAVTFANLAGGTNNASAMVLGTGASLALAATTTSPFGQNDANGLYDTVLLNNTSTGTTATYAACVDTTTANSAIDCAANAVQQVLGITEAGAGTTGYAKILRSAKTTTATFVGSTTSAIGNYATTSSAVGKLLDTASTTKPTCGNAIVGIITAINTGTTHTILVRPESLLPCSAGLPWSALGAPTGNLGLSMGTNTSIFSGTAQTSQFFALKNTTAAVVGTSQGSEPFYLCGRAFHGSADVEDCLYLSELPGNGNDAAITFTLGHTGTSTGAIWYSFPNFSTNATGVHLGTGSFIGAGQYSTVLGANAGTAAMGVNQTLIGYGAGLALTVTATDNVLIGELAGDSLTAAASNTFIGSNACTNTTTGLRDVCIGYNLTTPVVGTVDWLGIGSNGKALIFGDIAKGILGVSGPIVTISSNACGTTTQGVPITGSNNTFGGVTVGTTTGTGVTSCAISFANADAAAPFCTVTDQSQSLVIGIGYTLATTGITVTATSGLDSTVINWTCGRGSNTASTAP